MSGTNAWLATLSGPTVKNEKGSRNMKCQTVSCADRQKMNPRGGRIIGHVLFSVLLFGLNVLLTTPGRTQPLAKGQAKFLGSCMSTQWPSFSSYFNQVTPENDGKWGYVEGVEGSFSWTNLDNIYNFARANHYSFKDHNLVWGNQQPSWISPTTTLDSATQRAEVERWVDTVFQRYTGMQMIDVVNEPLHAVPSYANALGGNGQTGWDWVVTVFQWARKYSFPGMKLLINDYNILQDNTVTSRYIGLIDTLLARGLIDGIGIQGHYFEFKSASGATPVYSYPVSTLKSNLNRIAALGLPIYVSEFDINESNDSTQLANYQTYFPLFWEHPSVKGITLWGYVQGYTWQTNAYLVRSDGSERPALQWLRIYVATPAPVSPIGQTNQPRDVSLVWRNSAPATTYRVQVATDSTFLSVVVDSTVADTTLHVNPLAANSSFYWRVCARNSSGSSAYSLPSAFATGSQILAVERTTTVPTAFSLAQNYPNPFNPTTRIEYTIVRAGEVSLKVFNMLGEEVAALMQRFQQPGNYAVTFDGSSLPSGVYVCQKRSGAYAASKKLVLLK